MSDEKLLRNTFPKHYDEIMACADIIFRVKYGLEETPCEGVFYSKQDDCLYIRISKGYKRNDKQVMKRIEKWRSLLSKGLLKKNERNQLEYLESVLHLLRN